MKNAGKIRDVYADDMENEINKLSELIDDFNYISMDTEFPGIVYQKDFTKNESNYQVIKRNVESLKLIQVGFTLSDAEGNFPEDVSTWQFNLAFDKLNDLNSMDSICLLENAGIDFDRLFNYGAQHSLFAESLFPSGLILNDNLKWITFHGVYDFAYLLRLVSNLPLPNEEITFYNDLETFFPNFYDTRYLLNNFSWLKGSLTKIASDLDIQHFGAIHQAGSDSLVTSKLYYRIEENFPELDLNAEKNKLYGLGNLLNENNFNSKNMNNVKTTNNNNYTYYNNVNVMNNNIESFPSKFNTNMNYPINSKSPNVFQQNNVTYYNNAQQYYPSGNNKNAYVMNGTMNNGMYPSNNANNLMYYNLANQQNILVNNTSGKIKNNNIYNQNVDYNNTPGNNINQYYLKNEFKNSNISQFYPNINNNIASI